ncbi:MAG: RNA methyltransferase [Bacteroidales bacterium]|nr:RNA methyltransferase [Bacteroidales bacterium]
MYSIETITSAQNPKIKELLALQEKSRTRREKGLFVVEGRRELGHCIDAGYRPRTLFICSEIINEKDIDCIMKSIGSEDLINGQDGKNANSLDRRDRDSNRRDKTEHCIENGADNRYSKDGRPRKTCRTCNIIDIPAHLYDKVAYRGGTEGVIAEMEWKDRCLEELKLSSNPLIVVLESVEKPGNLGAVLRSADAAGADAVIICDPLTDLYNPNLIRSSIGAVFSRPVALASSEDTIHWLKEHCIKILTAQLQDSEWYYDTDMRQGTAIIMGTESTGLTDIWRNAADSHIKIPMLGNLDSLNVSVSAAILLYEAVRQRHSGQDI